MSPANPHIGVPLAVCIGLLCLASDALHAAEAIEEDGDGNRQLPVVTVVAPTPLGGAEIEREKIAAPVQTATSDDIDASHAVDLTDYLRRRLGSVHVNDIQNNPLQPDIDYRGYSASPLLGTPQGLSLYLDGMRLNQPFGDVVSWDLIPRAAIQSIVLMPGSNPLFGRNTLGGALSIQTKDGYANPGSAVQAAYGSDARRSVEVETGGHGDNGLHWYVTANEFREDGWRDDSPSDAKQFFGKIGWRGDATDLALSGAWADTDLNGNGLQEQRLLERDYASVYTKPDNTANRSSLLNLTAEHRFSDALRFSGNAYFRDLETATYNGDINEESLGESLYQPNAAERAALAAAGYSGFPLGGETQANTPFPSWRCIANALLNTEPNEKCNGLINRTRTAQQNDGISGELTFASEVGGRSNQFIVGGGYDASRVRFRQSSQFGYLTPDRGIIGVTGAGAYADGSQDSENAYDSRVDLNGRSETWSAYASNILSLSDALALTLSARYDRTTVDSTDHITPAGGPGSLDGHHTFSRVNPAIGLTWNPSAAFGAYAGYNQGSRAPSAIELGCADPQNPCRLPNSMAGDPPLKQVVTRTWEAGLRGSLADRTHWNAGVFRADNRDDILFVADDQTGFGYFKNFGKTRRQGIELGLDSSAGPFRFGANYTWLDATYRSEEEVNGEANSSNDGEAPGFEGNIEIEPGDRIPLIPKQVFKAWTSVALGSCASLTLDMIAIDSAYARGNENNEHEPDGVYYLGKGRSAGYAVFNLGGDWRPTANLTLFVQVSNLFDRRYATAAQLGATGFDASGNFVSRPFDGPVIDGERPALGSTFYAPGAPRAFWAGVRYLF